MAAGIRPRFARHFALHLPRPCPIMSASMFDFIMSNAALLCTLGAFAFMLALARFKARRCATVEEVRAWVAEERESGAHGQPRTDTDDHGSGFIRVRVGPCP